MLCLQALILILTLCFQIGLGGNSYSLMQRMGAIVVSNTGLGFMDFPVLLLTFQALDYVEERVSCWSYIWYTFNVSPSTAKWGKAFCCRHYILIGMLIDFFFVFLLILTNLASCITSEILFSSQDSVIHIQNIGNLRLFSNKYRLQHHIRKYGTWAMLNHWYLSFCETIQTFHFT